MYSYVHLQGSSLAKSFVARRTGVRFGLRVGAFVYHHRLFFGKGFTANLANERFFAAVQNHVVLQALSPAKDFPANFAHVLIFACVRFEMVGVGAGIFQYLMAYLTSVRGFGESGIMSVQMPFEVVFVHKIFIAMFALETNTFVMNLVVVRESGFVIKTPSTVIALVCKNLRVYSFVRLKVRFRSEGGTTDFAHVRATGGVRCFLM